MRPAAVEIILYVSNQEASRAFYENMLQMPPVLHVPGMTEFELFPGCKLGLMPNHGIAKILGNSLPHPETGYGIPRCELYLSVEDVHAAYQHALACGAIQVSEPADRNWGDCAAYVADPDGHVIAFAQKTGSA